MIAFTTTLCLQTSLSRRSHLNQTCKTARSVPRAVVANQNQSSSNEVTRRLFLNLLATMTATVALPQHANALTKKRILAKAGPPVTLPSGVVYRDINIGKGYSPNEGDTVAIHYSLFYDNLEVESSRESQGLAASPFGFTYGVTRGPGSTLPGLNIGMEGMKVGGLRLITLPPDLAFGQKGKEPFIPPNATVEFAVSLLSCKRQGTNPNSTINPRAQSF